MQISFHRPGDDYNDAEDEKSAGAAAAENDSFFLPSASDSSQCSKVQTTSGTNPYP